jgi:citrate lyase subunit beta/citryl-CoA lyase
MSLTDAPDPPRRAEAGLRGEEVRSDLWVEFERRERGGVAVELRSSRVAVSYGEAIREQAREVLARLGVRHGHLAIEDAGALPFTIEARIEAAVRRTGLPGAGRARPPGPLRPPGLRNRLRRSRLYLPGNQPKLFVNAGLHGADAVILDLEDSVHPREKDTARILVRCALAGIDFGRAERMVRINQLPLGLADLEEVVPQGPDLVLIPKVERAGEVGEVDRKITEIAGRERLERPVWLMPILESPLGVERAFDIATASRRNVALTIGLEDLTAELGVAKTATGEETLWARQRLVNAARAAGLQPIDSVFGDVGDVDALRAWARRSRGLGFVGMGCIHPRQVPVIHESFAPGADEIERARRIVAAFREAEARGLGVVSLGTKMIDPPVVQRAVALVEQARQMGLVDDAEGEQR